MKTLFTSALVQLKSGRNIMLVTIIDCRGSAPRGVGAKMWVAGEQEFDGTIGGGIIENLAIKKACELLKMGEHHEQEYNLSAEHAASIGMVCGGRICVSYYYISAQDLSVIGLFEQIVARFEQNQNTWLTISHEEKNGWKLAVDTAGETFHPVLTRSAGGFRYTEPVVKNETVLVFGGGHVAKELVPLLKKIGFRCVVFDDRSEFADQERFPEANDVICGDFDKIGDFVTISSEDYVAIMTRGHKFDLKVQAWALANKPCYIGVMGSKRKIAYVTEQLMESGYARAEIEACHMPIGMDIGAETPSELAVSIAGELIQVRSRK